MNDLLGPALPDRARAIGSTTLTVEEHILSGEEVAEIILVIDGHEGIAGIGPQELSDESKSVPKTICKDPGFSHTAIEPTRGLDQSDVVGREGKGMPKQYLGSEIFFIEVI